MTHGTSRNFLPLDKVRGMPSDAVIAIVTADIALVLTLSSLLSAAARRLGQPAVIGQILAGIAFGPSLLGHFPVTSPDTSSRPPPFPSLPDGADHHGHRPAPDAGRPAVSSGGSA
jgi:hypothetical protein